MIVSALVGVTLVEEHVKSLLTFHHVREFIRINSGTRDLVLTMVIVRTFRSKAVAILNGSSRRDLRRRTPRRPRQC